MRALSAVRVHVEGLALRAAPDRRCSVGRMKDDLPYQGPATFSRGGRGWADVSPLRRCPVCGGQSWCQVARDGLTVLCKRVGNGGRPKSNRDGVDYYAHHLGARPWTPSPEAPDPTTARASADDCDRAYRAALAALRLDDCDREGLRARGLDDGAIAANGYRSLGITGRSRIARAVVDAVGEHVAPGVPGLAWNTGDNDRGWWTFKGSAGLLIPVRDLAGRIVALKVRRRDVEPGQQRYLYVTSARAGGPSAASVVHVPRAALELRHRPLVITEGELKADVSTALCGRPVVSLPGVGAWRMALDVVDAWGAPEVAVAFDADARSNHNVARALVCLVDALRASGARVSTWRWDGPAKGLDDYLCAKRRGAATTHGL